MANSYIAIVIIVAFLVVAACDARVRRYEDFLLSASTFSKNEVTDLKTVIPPPIYYAAKLKKGGGMRSIDSFSGQGRLNSIDSFSDKQVPQLNGYKESMKHDGGSINSIDSFSDKLRPQVNGKKRGLNIAPPTLKGRLNSIDRIRG
jgi:hypothetical protein